MGEPRVKTGCCALCDVPVYEVTRTFPVDQGHPYGGENAEIAIAAGHPVRVVTLILSDGSQMSQPVCGECEVTPATLPTIWAKNMAAWCYEIENRAFLGGIALTARQKKQQIGHMLAKAATIPLGVLHSEMRGKDDRYFQRVTRG